MVVMVAFCCLQERAEEVALERTPLQVTLQGSLRVKTEEELQGVPSSVGGGPTILTTPTPPDSDGVRTGLPCRDVEPSARNTAAPFLIGSRRTPRSPPPEDWKPLDKCYFCLDGKLPHDDQPPLVSVVCHSYRFSLQRWLKRRKEDASWSRHGGVTSLRRFARNNPDGFVSFVRLAALQV